jgi:hypothetical protein
MSSALSAAAELGLQAKSSNLAQIHFFVTPAHQQKSQTSLLGDLSVALQLKVIKSSWATDCVNSV